MYGQLLFRRLRVSALLANPLADHPWDVTDLRLRCLAGSRTVRRLYLNLLFGFQLVRS